MLPGRLQAPLIRTFFYLLPVVQLVWCSFILKGISACDSKSSRNQAQHSPAVERGLIAGGRAIRTDSSVMEPDFRGV